MEYLPIQSIVSSQAADQLEGYILPSFGELEKSQESYFTCDHDCDREISQKYSDKKFVTSIIWTTDGGLPVEKSLGNCWVGEITILKDKERTSAWGEDFYANNIVTVSLNCTPEYASEKETEAKKAVYDEMCNIVKKFL